MRRQNFAQREKINDFCFTIGPYNLQSKIENRKSHCALISLFLSLFFFFNFLLLSCSDEEALLAKKEQEAEIIKKKADHMWTLKKEVAL